MKAAVLHHLGEIPQYEDFPDPNLEKDQVLIDVKAAALENVDKAMAEGIHFAYRRFFSTLPAIVELSFAHKRIRFIQIGEKAGSAISLPAAALCTSGRGGAGITPDALQEGTHLVWNLIQNNKLHIDIEKVPLQDIEKAWSCDDYKGRRAVIVI